MTQRKVKLLLICDGEVKNQCKNSAAGQCNVNSKYLTLTKK